MTPESPRPPEDAESDPRYPSGKWAGFWVQKLPFPAKPRQEMILTFRRGEIDGEGRDMVGHFFVRGFYSTDDGKCRWHKKYVGKHDVFYQGFAEGKGIWGTWEVEGNQGGFHIWPEGVGEPSSPALEAEAEPPVELVGEPVTVG